MSQFLGLFIFNLSMWCGLCRSDAVHEELGRLLDMLEDKRVTQEGTSVSIAKGLFLQQGFPVNESFVNRTIDLYHSEVSQVDFQSNPREAMAAVNKWVLTKATSTYYKDLWLYLSKINALITNLKSWRKSNDATPTKWWGGQRSWAVFRGEPFVWFFGEGHKRVWGYGIVPPNGEGDRGHSTGKFCILRYKIILWEAILWFKNNLLRMWGKICVWNLSTPGAGTRVCPNGILLSNIKDHSYYYQYNVLGE